MFALPPSAGPGGFPLTTPTMIPDQDRQGDEPQQEHLDCGQDSAEHRRVSLCAALRHGMAPARAGNPQHWVRARASPEMGTAMCSLE
jgi:hypothetical protein